MGSRVTAPAVRAHKVASGADPLVMVTAYDAPGARMADDAGVDLILVGDSLAMVVLGYDDTLQVTVDDMAHHTAAVARAKPSALVVADLPWLSYHVSVEDTVRNAAQLVRADLVGAGALGQVSDLARQPGQVQVTGVVDHRDGQAALGVDGDAQVRALVVGDRLGGHVHRGPDRRPPALRRRRRPRPRQPHRHDARHQEHLR